MFYIITIITLTVLSLLHRSIQMPLFNQTIFRTSSANIYLVQRRCRIYRGQQIYHTEWGQVYQPPTDQNCCHGNLLSPKLLTYFYSRITLFQKLRRNNLANELLKH